VRPHLHRERLLPPQRSVALRHRRRRVAGNGVGANHREDIVVGRFPPDVETFRREKRELESPWLGGHLDNMRKYKKNSVFYVAMLFHLQRNFKLWTVARRRLKIFIK